MHGSARIWRARLNARRGQCMAAVEQLEEAHVVLPENIEILTFLSKMLAACSSDRDTDSVRGLELATQAFRAQSEPATAVAVAVAHAGLGEFEAAARWQSRAIELAVERGLKAPQEMHDRLKQYRAGRWAPLPW